MSKVQSAARIVAVGGLVLIAACATDGGVGRGPDSGGRAEVTRFFLASDFARGTVFVEPLDPSMAGSPRFAAIRGAVEDNLRNAGFRPVPTRDNAEEVAVVGIKREIRAGLPGSGSGSRVSGGFGVGGGSGRGGVGGGVGLGLSFGGHRGGHDTGVDTMSISIRRRSDATAIWEGTARGEVRADKSGDPADRAFFLARALLADFPGPKSGTTVSYPPRHR